MADEIRVQKDEALAWRAYLMAAFDGLLATHVFLLERGLTPEEVEITFPSGRKEMVELDEFLLECAEGLYAVIVRMSEHADIQAPERSN